MTGPREPDGPPEVPPSLLRPFLSAGQTGGWAGGEAAIVRARDDGDTDRKRATRATGSVSPPEGDREAGRMERKEALQAGE